MYWGQLERAHWCIRAAASDPVPRVQSRAHRSPLPPAHGAPARPAQDTASGEQGLGPGQDQECPAARLLGQSQVRPGGGQSPPPAAQPGHDVPGLARGKSQAVRGAPDGGPAGGWSTRPRWRELCRGEGAVWAKPQATHRASQTPGRPRRMRDGPALRPNTLQGRRSGPGASRPHRPAALVGRAASPTFGHSAF